ncbi:hypothetical protein P9112_011403 [Eukaryota sp. TZLM1-RC]
MCKSYRVDSFSEPLLSTLILEDANIDSTPCNRASMGLTRVDLIVPSLNGSFTTSAAMSVNPCYSFNEHFINSDVNDPLLAGEKYKIAKYANSDAFKFLGCWLGNVPQIQNELQVILEKMKIELDSISSLDIEKHIKFFMLKICYTGRITHILRSCAPSIALDFCRSFNSLRTEFFADLLDVEPGMLKSHLFSSANLGGIGFTKSSILCQSAFLGGGKNFIYEFSRRFPDDSHLLVPNCSPYLYELSCELEKLPPQIWTKCFPQSIQEIPNRSLFNLQFCCKKLQQKLSKIFESLDFDVRLGLAKKKNPAFANLFTRYV